MINLLKEGLKKSDICVSDTKINKILDYIHFLKDYNKKVNLTALKTDKDIIEKHFIDSLILKNYINQTHKKIIDIGTGAGFPGLALSILFEDKNFFLLESIKKKCEFLKKLNERLNLKNVTIINERAEVYIRKNLEKYESFDVGLCRGVAELKIILEYVVPFLKVEGIFLAQKVNYEEELLRAEQIMQTLNCKFLKEEKFNLPFSRIDRKILIIKKTKKTSRKFPRDTKEIIKKKKLILK